MNDRRREAPRAAATVRDWITSRSPASRPALTEQILAALGRDAEAPEAQTAKVCLAAAARGLDALLSENRFGRDSALDLLTIDALTTYAFEHASQSDGSEEDLVALTKHGAGLFGQLTTQRV
jgi:hypothetical protein